MIENTQRMVQKRRKLALITYQMLQKEDDDCHQVNQVMVVKIVDIDGSMANKEI